MNLITDTRSLAAFCASLEGADFVTVDTEFMREKTYWPKLCLVQLGGPDEAAAVDPMAEGIDLSPLFDLMANEKILKVFHAARQDVEIFWHLTGRVPAPMFDTQVAAMVCGFGDSVSYETLVAKLAGAQLDKASRFTDWAQRPLTERQLTYALGDVTHLRLAYEKISQRLEKTGRGSWLAEEMATLTSPDTYRMDPELAWKRLKVRADKPRLRAMLKELAALREQEAQRLDIPRGRVLRDEALLEIAHHAPRTIDDLARTRGLSGSFAEGKMGAAIMEAVERALSLPSDQCPPEEARRDLPPGLGSVVELLRVLLKIRCDEHEVASRLVAVTDDLEAIAASDNADVPALKGWRGEVFGKSALELKHGRLAMTLDGRKIKLVEC